MTKRSPKAVVSHEPTFPTRHAHDLPRDDNGRRRFLKQIALGAAGAALVANPSRSDAAAGSKPQVRYHKLTRHPVPPEAAANADTQVAELGTVEIVENRSMWLDPGYLVMLRWRRAESDIAVVAALEGSSDAVAAFLAERVTSVDHLHNIDQLHTLESDLLRLLSPRVASAVIEVLHIDHDCSAVCGVLEPSRTYPTIYEIDGDIPAPGWE